MGQVFQTRYLPLGGVNNSIGDEFIKETECADAANYQPDLTAGTGLIKREGLTKASSIMTKTISSVYSGRNANYFTADTVIYNFAGTSLKTGMTAGYPDWTSFATYDCVVNGTDLQMSATGANGSFSAITNCPAGAKYIAAANNFVYVAGHDKGKLRWADVGTLTTWTGTNELILTQDENDDITAIKPWRNALLVCCSKSFELVSGYSTLEQGISYYSKEEGCLSHRSLVITPAGVFWWSKAGITWVRPDFTIDYPTARKIPKTLASLNWAQNAYVHATFDPIQHRVMFYVFVGSATACDLRIDYYWDTDSIWLHTGAGVAMASSGMAVVSGVANNYAGGYASAANYLYKVSGATDDGTSITAYFDTKREAYASPTAYKVTKNVTLHTNLSTQGAITYQAWIDNDAAADTSWANTIATGIVDTVIGVNRQHRKIRHRVTDALATTTRILGLTHDGTVVRRV